MAIVASRNANYPNYTNNSLKYSYSFVQPPPAWSTSSPAGIICDEKIMPNRDIDDAANGTDTWKVLRGVDLYFATEGALERWYAGQQFQLPGTWPRSTYTVVRNRGIIESNLWQWTQGNDPQVSIKNGLASCYDNLWLKGISSSSDLQTSYSTWADGTVIGPGMPANASDSRGIYWHSFLDFAIGKWALSDMVSRYDDFEPGDPLVADNVRRVYYDLQRLQWYMPHTGDGTAWNVSQQSTTGWSMSNWSSFTGGFSPLPPTTPTAEIWHEERQVFDYGTADELGGYWGYYTNAGTYTCPRTGLLNANGSRTEYFGSEQACYLALHLTTGGDNVSQKDIYEFWKVPFSTTSSGYVQVAANQVSNAAYSMVNKWNAGVPRSFGSEYRWTFVYLEHISIVCKTSDRTDVSQLGWTWTP